MLRAKQVFGVLGGYCCDFDALNGVWTKKKAWSGICLTEVSHLSAPAQWKEPLNSQNDSNFIATFSLSLTFKRMCSK